MKNYLVTIPIAGSYTVEVEVEDSGSEGDAIQKALGMDWLEKIELSPGAELEDINSYEALGRGNVSYVDVEEASAEEIVE